MQCNALGNRQIYIRTITTLGINFMFEEDFMEYNTASDLEKQDKTPHKGSKKLSKQERKKEKQFRRSRKNARGRGWLGES